MNANNQQLVNALRGPVIMITIGILFLLDNLTPLGVGQTWPIFLIVIGVLALAGGSRRQTFPGPTQPYPGNFPPEGFASHEAPPTNPGEYRR